MSAPIDFPEANFTFKGGPKEKYGTQNDVQDLRVWRTEDQHASCWRLTWRERFSALFFGKAWLHVATSGPPPPIALNVVRKFFK